MKKIFYLFVSLFFLNSAYAADKPMMDIQHWQTKNGAQVYFVQAMELPMVDVQMVFSAGSVRDEQLAGLAQATNAMLNQAAVQEGNTLDADKIAERFEKVGAQYGADVNRDMAFVQLRSLTDPNFLQPALQMFATVLTAPTFSPTAWQRIQKQMLVDLQAEQQSPRQIAYNAFYKKLYGNQPYAHAVNGTLATVAKITAQQLQAFYQHYYVANNAIVAIVGAVDKSTAIKIAEQVVANLPAGQKVAAVPMEVAGKTAQQEAIVFPSQQTTILLGQVGINLLNPDYFPLQVGNYILGGGGYMMSRLFQEVRNKRGLTYGINSSFVTLNARGPFYIAWQSRTEQASTAIAITQNTLQTFINQGPTEQELTAAKKSIIGEFPLHFSNNANLLHSLVSLAFYKLPLDYYDTYREKINAVTIQQICNTFQKNIHPDAMTIVTVGNSGKTS